MHIPSLTQHVDSEAACLLYWNISSLQTFFDDSTLLTDHINELNVVSSLIGSIVSTVLHPPVKLAYQSDSDAYDSELTPPGIWRKYHRVDFEPDSWIFRVRIRVYHSA
ncbi:hypothetical protein BU17DRAFT_88286 [Hysterangium stoloniferum]|nr:hypothetical protein BU17DRAFT_88286 [Hysterangium stoloniferum]